MPDAIKICSCRQGRPSHGGMKHKCSSLPLQGENWHFRGRKFFVNLGEEDFFKNIHWQSSLGFRGKIGGTNAKFTVGT